MTQFKENLKLRKACFEKVGAVWTRPEPDRLPNTYCWMLNGKEISKRGLWHPDWEGNDAPFLKDYKEKLLPPIETTWEVTAQYLGKFMRGKGWSYDIESLNIQDKIIEECFSWEFIHKTKSYSKQIIDDNIALVACELFMEVRYE